MNRLWRWMRRRSALRAYVRPVSTDEVDRILLPVRRPTRLLVLHDGDPGAVPVTKVGGVPWWPANRPRPSCQHGHDLAFIMQVDLADVAGCNFSQAELLSFHYCQQCSYDGQMPWGFPDDVGRGYDVSVMDTSAGQEPDHRGQISESPVPPKAVTFEDVDEIPEIGDWDIIPDADVATLNRVAYDDFQLIPATQHIEKSKIGGWPTWCQNPEWPVFDHGTRMTFVAQIDTYLGEQCAWGGGGYAYLFATPPEIRPCVGEMAILTT